MENKVPAEKTEFVTLNDGRRLAYATWGDPKGEVLLICHGWPGSRLVGAALHNIALKRGLRLVVPDRPGIGLSDSLPQRTVRDWPKDVQALMAHLNVNRFSVLGYSGGGPYALACASNLPEQVQRVTLVSSMGPLGLTHQKSPLPRHLSFAFLLFRRLPAVTRLTARLLRQVLRHPTSTLFRRMLVGSPKADHHVLSQHPTFSRLRHELLEAYRQGSEGVAHELHLLARPWEIDLQAVTAPIALWHGKSDSVVPVSVAQALARNLRKANFRLLEGRGHYFLFDDFSEIHREGFSIAGQLPAEITPP